MSDPLSVTPGLLEAFSRLRDPAVYTVGFLVLAYMVYRVVVKRMDAAEAEKARLAAQAADEGKKQRAETYAKAFGELRTTVDKLAEAQLVAAREKSGLRQAISESVVATRTLAALHKGALNVSDSRKLIGYEITGVCEEVCRIAAVSLRRNHFGSRGDVIKLKMTGRIEKLLSDALKQLQSLTLAFDASVYFERTPGTSHNVASRRTPAQGVVAGPTFVLTSRIWDALVPHYQTAIAYGDESAMRRKIAHSTDSIVDLFREALARGDQKRNDVMSDVPTDDPTEGGGVALMDPMQPDSDSGLQKIVDNARGNVTPYDTDRHPRPDPLPPADGDSEDDFTPSSGLPTI